MNTANHTNILVIDDDVDIGNMLKMILEYKGFNVTYMENPEKVKDVMQQKNIDVVILDMLLSGANGTDICGELKKDPLFFAIPIIMMSAHPDARKTCIDAGADEFMPKPFDLQDMLSNINSYISNNNPVT